MAFQLDKTVVSDLQLGDAGLVLSDPKSTISLQPDASHVTFHGDTVTGTTIGNEDVTDYRNFRSQMRRLPRSWQHFTRGVPQNLWKEIGLTELLFSN